jgi:hypothetical protein
MTGRGELKIESNAANLMWGQRAMVGNCMIFMHSLQFNDEYIRLMLEGRY